jgi:hypothetical protein
LFGCDLDQINERPNENGTFLDRVFTNVPVGMAVGVAETPLFNLNRYQKASDIEMQISSCKFEAMEGGIKRYMFKLANCVAIVDELGVAFYQVDGSTKNCEQKLPWMTRQLTLLRNNKTKASKKLNDSEKRCLKDDAIDNSECKRLQEKFVSLREEYQQQHDRAYDDYRARIGEAIKCDPKAFDLKKKRVDYPSVMHFESRLASGSEEICDLFAEFIQRTYTDDIWVPFDLSPKHVPDDPPFGALQFTSDEVESILQHMDVI